MLLFADFRSAMATWAPFRKCRSPNRMEKNEIILLVYLCGPDIDCRGGRGTGGCIGARCAEHHAAGSRAACFAPQSRRAHRRISGGREATRQRRSQKFIFPDAAQ